MAWPRSTPHRRCCHHRHQTEGNATHRSHSPDGSGTTRSLGACHHLRLPRVSSTLRRLTRQVQASKGGRNGGHFPTKHRNAASRGLADSLWARWHDRTRAAGSIDGRSGVTHRHSDSCRPVEPSTRKGREEEADSEKEKGRLVTGHYFLDDTTAQDIRDSGPRYRGSNPCLPANSKLLPHNGLYQPPASGFESPGEWVCKPFANHSPGSQS